MTVTGLDPDGVTPDSVGATTRLIAGSFGNFLAFTYTGGDLPIADTLSIDIPSAWIGSRFDAPFSAEEARYETPGYVRVKQGSCAAPGELAVVAHDDGGSTLDLDGFSCGRGETLSIELFYVTAPAQAGQYDFPTRVQGLSLPSLDQPSVAVHPVPDVALRVSQAPSTVEAGVPFDVVLTALRDNGKVHRGYRGTARFVGGCPEGHPDVIFTKNDQGSKLVSGLVLQLPGDRSFTFRDVGNLARAGEAELTVTRDGDGDPDGCGVRFH
jgi:hypothetical protein